jgi:hypothetical protein
MADIWIICGLNQAPVAQLDRVPGYEPGGRRFESFRARHIDKRAIHIYGLPFFCSLYPCGGVQICKGLVTGRRVGNSGAEDFGCKLRELVH